MMAAPDEALAEQLAHVRRTLGKMEIALGAIGEAIVWTDDRARIEWCNTPCDRLLRGTHLELLGRPLPALLPLTRDGFAVPGDAHPVHRALSGEPWGRGTYETAAPLSPARLDIAWTRVSFAHGQPSAVLAMRDVSLEQQTARELVRRAAAVALLQEVTAAANESSSVDEAFQRCLDAVCTHTGWPVGHAYRHDGHGLLRSTGVWHLARPAPTFRVATETRTFSTGEGLPGRVLASGRAAWIPDVVADANFPRGPSAAVDGLHAAFAMPVRAGRDVEAVLEFFTVDAAAPDARLLDVMEHVGTQLGRVIERDHAARALRAAQNELEARVAQRTKDWAQALDAIQVEILERERTLEALLASEDRYRKLIDAAGDVIVTIDIDGRVASANAAFTTVLGWSAESWLGRPALDLVAEPGRPTAAALMDQVRRGETPPNFELPLLAVGRELIGEFSARPILANGSVAGILVVCRDVTTRAELARAKDDLVSTVSHELRTPLASLLGFTELMLHREHTPEQRREFLGIIHEESKRLTALINDFLDLQRMDAGRLEYRMIPTDVAPLLAECVRMFAATSDRHTLTAEVPPDLPIVNADGDRLRQAIDNLLSNAIKYSPDGGPVRLRAGSVAGGVLITVEDAGIGIPIDALPKLFGRFYRVDNREVRRIGGTGLGLALVREIVEAHGGTVGVASTVGEGTTFAIRLPAIDARRDAAAPL